MKAKRVGKYPVVRRPDKTGEVHEMVVVPLDEIFTREIEAEKRTLISRVSSQVKSWFTNQTSDADDEGTTDLGSYVTASGKTPGMGNQLADYTKEENTRQARYRDYDKIDEECVELSRALSVTVSNVFTSREGDQESYEVKSDDSKVEGILLDTEKQTEMQNELPPLCRVFLKYGDDFEEMVVDSNLAVVRFKWLSPKHMTRQEDEFGRLQSDAAFVMKSENEDTVASFKPWQVVHMRHDHQRGDRYGRSFFYSSRNSWRKLGLMEDGVVMNRLVKATDRMVYYIPLPKGCTEEEARKIINNAKRDLKRQSIVDPSTGKLDLRKSPLADDEDIFIGIPPDTGPRVGVERLGGSGITGQLLDIEYFQNKMFMSTGVPKSYLGLERDVNAKATLSWQDIEYARILRHIQKEMAWFQRRVFDLQLVLLGYTPTDELYSVIYPPISFVDEEMKMNIEQLRWNIATTARTLNIPMEWVLKEILKLNDDQIGEIMASMEASAPVVQPPASLGAPASSKALANVPEQVTHNVRLFRQIAELRDMISVIHAERLNQRLVA